jgi:hypothetical protein
VARHFLWLILGFVLGVLNLVEIGTGKGVGVPAPVFWSVLAAGFLVASVLAYHDLRMATAGTSGDVDWALRRIKDNFAQARHDLLQLDVGNDPFRARDFMDDPDTHGLPTYGWDDLPYLEQVLSEESYDLVLAAFMAIDEFNKTTGGVRDFGDSFKTGRVRQAIDRAEDVLP